MTRPLRATATLLAAVAAAATLVTVPHAVAAARITAAPVSDPAADAATDLRSARLEQNGPVLTVWLGFAATPSPAAFDRAAGGRLCVWAESGGTTRHRCLRTSGDRWPAAGGDVEALRSGERRLGLRFAADALRPGGGPVRWWVTATTAACTEPPEAPATPDTPAPAAPADVPPCTDRLPDAGAHAGRIYRALVTGCKASGPSLINHGPRDRPRVALTFDDGPSGYTGAVLDVLASRHAPATFFVLGGQVSGSGAATLRRVRAAGHELANHSFSHPLLGSGGPRATDELARTNARIRKATGFTPCLFRPPYGDVGSDLVARAKALGMTSVIWDVDTLDWRRPGAGSIAATILRAQSGSIVLMHDGGGERSQTVAGLRAALPELDRRYTLVTLSELLGYDRRYTLVR